ncbi:MAG: hypothetical protein MRERV_43c013 [Mycoplasmataceae bacterium RV_VA103A]|nr:MAG: hypothetical protein MRERV_43c013 [Mycoplasmataceae bacterium RV_VA103A]
MEQQELTCVCFHCQKPFKINYNRGVGMHSQKNYWLYWVDGNWNYKEIRRKPESERGEKICDGCLKDVYLTKKWELLDQIKNKSRRQTLASYIYHEVI